jgi:threonylcarbamoyladenosine tRNA methylthiotransferase MtaB
MKIYLDTIGCRLNQAEIEAYARQFRAAGHTLVPTPEQADLAVVNTCAVTSAAVSDSRQKIRKLGRQGAGEIVVTGCWSTLQPEEAASLPGVRSVVANLDKDHLVSDLLQIPPETFDLEPVERQPIPGARLRTRAFIKVQDGCENRCTFCITTLARGPGRSRPIHEVLAEIHATADAREIVLTGVHLGSWGQDLSPRLHLRHLVQAILDDTAAPRLRLSSLEPWDLQADFFQLWENPRLCRHLHLPLQSGCAATLRRMARKTTPQGFTALVAAARQVMPDVAITTDVIAGFPGETDAEFEDSLEFVRSVHFAGGHVFPYSARQGTAAARMPGQVPQAVRKERSARLRARFAEDANAYQAAFIGCVLPVLWESALSLGPEGWEMSGLTGNYLRVNAQAARGLWNQITPVSLTHVSGDHLTGHIMPA